MSEETQYLVATLGEDVLVVIRGRAVYTTCRDFGEFLEKLGKSDTKRLIIDMQECLGVDSTVLGLIAGAAEDFRARGGVIVLQRCNERIAGVVENLGLPALLDFLPAGKICPETEEILASGTTAHAAAPATNHTILVAHEKLMAANPENVARFKQVVEFMRADLGI